MRALRAYLEAGKLVTTHGVTGEMKIELWCDGASFLKQFKTLYFTQNPSQPIEVVSVREHGRVGLIRLKGVESIEDARAYIGKALYFARKDAKMPKDTWFRCDLLGCEVRDATDGGVYGVVSKIDHPGPQDIYTVKSPSGKEYMFPGVPEFLKEKHPMEGYIAVAPIDGMFDEGAVQAKPEAGDKAPTEEA
ncbi:MAG: ribosome maturation factor RimM [Faecalibacterium sp.]